MKIIVEVDKGGETPTRYEFFPLAIPDGMTIMSMNGIERLLVATALRQVAAVIERD